MSTRKFSRVRFRVDATVITTGRTFQGQVENLSMSGLFVRTDERMAVGDVADITVVLSGTSPEIAMLFSGIVTRLTPEGIAFGFDRIDLDSYTHLKNVVAYNFGDSEKVNEEIYSSIDERMKDI